MLAFRPPPHRLRALATAAVALVACGPSGDPHGAVVAPPSVKEPLAIRVVTLSPLATRFVSAIGAGHRLVGVDAESARIPELAGIPVVDLAGAAGLSPDLVLVPALPDADAASARALRATGAELVEFAPHDLEDVFLLCREIGGRLVGIANALRFETGLARPLALIGGASFGVARPRVLAIVGLDPLELAGGHSFETDLIEIAGGRSLTHGGDETRLPLRADQLAEYAPDLILVVSPGAATPAEQRAARDALPEDARIEFFPLDTEQFWLRDPVEPARRLRAMIEPLSRELETRRSDRANPGGVAAPPRRERCGSDGREIDWNGPRSQ